MFYSTTYESPIGPLEIRFSTKGIRRVLLPGREIVEDEVLTPDGSSSVVDATVEQLNEYFDGRRERFALPLDLDGTEFQMLVWESLVGIAYGSTCTYASLAKKIGRPKAARPVGAANAANPIPIIIPCHRVIGADGSLTGYGGGSELLYIKEHLLNLEEANANH